MSLSEQLRFTRLWKGIGALFILAAFVLSLGPDVITPKGFSHIDKLVHAISYSGLTFWFLLIYPRRAHWKFALAFVIMGGLIEILQSFSPYHVAEVNDEIANIVGVTMGWLLASSPIGGILAWIDQSLARIFDASNRP